MSYRYHPTIRNNKTFGKVFDFMDRENRHQWIDLSRSREVDDRTLVTDLVLEPNQRLLDFRIPTRCAQRQIVRIGDSLTFVDPHRTNQILATATVESTLIHPELGSRNVGRCLVGNWKATSSNGLGI